MNFPLIKKYIIDKPKTPIKISKIKGIHDVLLSLEPPKTNTDYKNIIGKPVALIKLFKSGNLEVEKIVNAAALSEFIESNLEVAQYDFPIEMMSDDAQKACEALGDGWRLPTKSELNNLYKNQDKIGGFVHFVYWSSSSSKDDGRYRWRQEFSFGSQGVANDGDKKLFFSYARAVRDKK